MKLMKLNIQLFGHTNSTQNYELPQFIGTDKPTWLGDFNTAMSTIDAGMAENASDITGLDTRVTSAEGVASQASSDVSTLTSTVNTLSGNVTTATTTANNAQSTATSALNTANSADGKATTNATNIGDLTDLDTTAKTDLVSAINEVNEKNIITIGLSGDYTIPTTNTALKITGWTALDTIGSKLSLSNNQIVIGSGVSKVKVSFVANVRSSASATAMSIYLRYNNTFISQETASFTATNQSEELVYIPRLIDVQENGTIDLLAYGTQGNKVLAGYDSIIDTIMTVEVVA